MYKAWYLLSKEQLLKAASLKLETTSNNYSDIFILTVKAFGGELKNKPSGKKASSLPAAGFDQMASFIGAI